MLSGLRTPRARGARSSALVPHPAAQVPVVAPRLPVTSLSAEACRSLRGMAAECRSARPRPAPGAIELVEPCRRPETLLGQLLGVLSFVRRPRLESGGYDRIQHTVDHHVKRMISVKPPCFQSETLMKWRQSPAAIKSRAFARA